MNSTIKVILRVARKKVERDMARLAEQRDFHKREAEMADESIEKQRATLRDIDEHLAKSPEHS